MGVVHATKMQRGRDYNSGGDVYVSEDDIDILYPSYECDNENTCYDDIPSTIHIQTQEPGCPEGWTELISGCYLAQESPMNWERARVFCSNMDAEMVVIESEVERQEIAKMTAHLLKKRWRFWVGVKRIGGSWKMNSGKNPTIQPWG